MCDIPKVMILAAGHGERLRPLTLSVPKPLVKLNNKPCVIWNIEQLVDAGIQEIVMNGFWLSSQLKEVLKDGRQWGISLKYSIENEKLGTGGGIKNALPLLGDEPFIVVSADIATNYPFKQLIQKKLTLSLGHLICIPNPNHHQQGDYCLENGYVQEKCSSKKSVTFGSIALLHPSLFHHEKKNIFSIASIFQKAIKEQQLTGEYFTGYHCNMDTLERLKKVEKDIQSGHFKFSGS